VKVEELIPDALWEEIRRFLPPPKPRRRRHPGRKPMDPRRPLTGIVFVLKSGIPWEMLPQELGCGSGMSCWRYLRSWQQQGVWKAIHKVLLARLRGSDKIDFSRAVIDSSSVRAVLGEQDGAEPYRSQEKGDQTSSHHRGSGDSPCGPCHGGEPQRRDAVAAPGAGHSCHRRQAGSAPETSSNSARRRCLRFPCTSHCTQEKSHTPSHPAARNRSWKRVREDPLGHRTHFVLAPSESASQSSL